MAKLCALLFFTGLASVAGQNYEDLQKLGVNFATYFIDGNRTSIVPGVAKKSAELGVVRIKMFDFDADTIYQLRKYYAFAQKKLEIMVGISQWVSNPPDGKGEPDWAAINGMFEVIGNNSDVVKGVFVGNEPCTHGLCGGEPGENFLAVLENVTDRLKAWNMTAGVPFSSPCIMPMTWEKIPFFQRVLRILKKTNSPLTVNLYPYLDYCFKPQIGLNYALGSNGPGGPLLAWSQIDSDISRVRGDLAKLGPEFQWTPVQIGESGWAHEYGEWPQWNGQQQLVYKVSNYNFSNSFYINLLHRLRSLNLVGIYIFELAEETKKDAIFPAWESEKHFGITGLYKNSSLAPWHIDDPSKHPPWTGFASMRPQDWKQFDTEQERLKWVVEHMKNTSEADLAAKQLLWDKAGAEKIRGKTQPWQQHGHDNQTANKTATGMQQAVSEKWLQRSPDNMAERAIWTGSAAALVAGACMVSIAVALRRRRPDTVRNQLLAQHAAE